MIFKKIRPIFAGFECYVCRFEFVGVTGAHIKCVDKLMKVVILARETHQADIQAIPVT